MARRLSVALLALALAGPWVAQAETSDRGAARAYGAGWGYLIERLVADGFSRADIVEVFADSRMEPFDGLEFSVAPREPRSRYRHFLEPAGIAAARACRARFAPALEAAESRRGVPASLVAAILYVESNCGRNTGSSVVLYRLARLAMANEPANLRANLARKAIDAVGAADAVLAEQVRARARYLEATFYPEVRAVFELAQQHGIDPLALRGSSSGAFGYPQFLPTSYIRHGVDADGDGRVSLDGAPDAAASCANYLTAHGWRTDLSPAEQRAVIWQYNHSDAYIDAVLALAEYIDGRPIPEPPRRVQKPRSATRRAQRKGRGTNVVRRARPQRS